MARFHCGSFLSKGIKTLWWVVVLSHKALFWPVMDANYRLVAPPPRKTAVGGRPKVASCGMIGKQLHYSSPVNHGRLNSSFDMLKRSHF